MSSINRSVGDQYPRISDPITAGVTALGTVAIGRNEGERLVRCLSSLTKEHTAIVYVDSGSSDASVMQARHFGAIAVELDPSKPFSAGRARNEGFLKLLQEHHEIEFVQFIDGDCELSPDWLEKGRHFLENHPNIALVCGRRRERDPNASLYNRLCDLEWDTPVGPTKTCGGDFLIRASAFAALGGFNPRLRAGEEPELCLRLRKAGWRIWRMDAEMTLHDAALTRVRQWWLRSVRSGFGFAQVWAETRREKEPLYQRELRSTFIWGAILPIMIGLGAVVSPWLGVTIGLIFPLQFLRIARRSPAGRLRWAYALLIMFGKFAEVRGALAWFIGRRRREAPIEYK